MKSRILAALIILLFGIFISCSDDTGSNSEPLPMGDLNNNGIAFEIADLVMFQNYLVGGVEAVPEQTIPGLSDMNRDGKAFTVADYACFKMIFDGDAKYGQQFPTDPVEVKYEFGENLYVFEPIAAIRLVLEGAADVVLLPDNVEMRTDRRDGKTYVLITPPLGEPGGELSEQLVYLDHARILQIEMALPDGSPVIPINNIPETAVLLDNYPNPFSVNTTISFDLAKRSFWKIEIFDVEATLVDEFSDISNAGRVEIVWDPGDLPGGVYFYRLTLGSETYTKAMYYYLL